MEGDIGGVGPLQLQATNPNVGGSVGWSLDGPALVIKAASLIPSKVSIDPSSSALNQSTSVINTSHIRPSHQNKESGGPSNHLRKFVNLELPSAKNFDLLSNLSPMKISCFNPIFVGQEASKENGAVMWTKSVLLVPEPIEVQDADSPGGLNPNRHTAVSFKEKGPAEGENSRRMHAPISGSTKIRSMGKMLGGKDGVFELQKD
ncbi:hypothetical protein PVK06_017080 [Gossypium arboreum]|uniref:Uncharacterized protein n=1 Tax=Gossypium arboreum TaxID=29729 RepID=A0ABR0Q1R4_GOSAR|nr:hypothetical protein PVK06_017080 [Gossypium arboreum]